MARKSFVLLTIGMMIFFFASVSSADVPHMINYQGKLTTAQGGCLNATVSMTFTIYSDSLGTFDEWSETQEEVVVKEGVFSVLLGSVDSIPAWVFEGSIKYLGVQVESDPEMSPLKPMVSVPYAYRAGTADGGGGNCGWVDDGTVVRLETGSDSVGIGTVGPVSKLDVGGNVEADGFTINGVPVGTSTDSYWSASDGDIYYNSGNVGIGTADPNTKLDVAGAVSVNGPVHHPVGYHLFVNNSVVLVRDNIGDAAGVAYWTAMGEDWYTGTLINEDYYTIRCNADDKLVVTQDGNVGIGTESPEGKLHVTEADKTGLVVEPDDGDVALGSQTGPTTFWNLRLWADNSGFWGNVGIGTMEPDYELDVDGDAGFNQHLYHNEDEDTYIEFTNDQIDLFAGGVQMITADEDAQDIMVINEGGADVDFRVESNNDVNALFVRGSDGNVGIGTADPNTQLDVAGAVSVNGPAQRPEGYHLFVNNSLMLIRDNIGGAAGVSYWTTDHEDWYIGTLINEDYYTINCNADDKLVVTRAGKVGIGTSTPDYELDVNGDAGFNEFLYHNGDANTYIQFTDDQIDLFAGGVQMITANGWPIKEAVINEGSDDVDFRVESDNDPNALFVRGNDGHVGIGTTSPSTELHVDGDVTVEGGVIAYHFNGLAMARVYRTDSSLIVSTQGKQLIWDKTNGEIEITNNSPDSCHYWWQAQKGPTTSGNSGVISDGSENVPIISGINTDSYGFEVHFGQADGPYGWCSVWLQYAKGTLVGHYILY